MLGKRLRIARVALGLSLRDLASRIANRVSAQAISKYERGLSVPSSPVLQSLAEALDVSVSYLANDQEMILERVEFRRKKMISRREETMAHARVLGLLERYLMIEEYLRLPTTTWDQPRQAPYPVVGNLLEAEQAARALRAHWGLGVGPIASMVEVLEDHGIKVLSLAFERIDGLTARARRKHSYREPVPVIVVNHADWGERQRFTMAHELGHLVMDVAPTVDDEKAAHRFASAFLMPSETIRSEIGRRRRVIAWRELFDLKVMFGVSVQALAYRCRELGVIGPGLFRRLFKSSHARAGGVLHTGSRWRWRQNDRSGSGVSALGPWRRMQFPSLKLLHYLDLLSLN